LKERGGAKINEQAISIRKKRYDMLNNRLNENLPWDFELVNNLREIRNCGRPIQLPVTVAVTALLAALI
jgi:hypothetical protein